MSALRLLVVEDHPVFRDGLLAAMARAPHMEVVAVGGSLAEGLALLAQHELDVALVDLGLPDGSGVELVDRAAQAGVQPLVLTMSGSGGQLVEAVRAGARGYLVKGAARDDIIAAVEAVARGEVVFGADVAATVLQAVAAQDARRVSFPDLSDREAEVLELLGLGLPNRSIADRLGLSDKTVRNHVSSILTKLGVESRHEAADLVRAVRRQP